MASRMARSVLTIVTNYLVIRRLSNEVLHVVGGLLKHSSTLYDAGKYGYLSFPLRSNAVEPYTIDDWRRYILQPPRNKLKIGVRNNFAHYTITYRLLCVNIFFFNFIFHKTSGSTFLIVCWSVLSRISLTDYAIHIRNCFIYWQLTVLIVTLQRCAYRLYTNCLNNLASPQNEHSIQIFIFFSGLGSG